MLVCYMICFEVFFLVLMLFALLCILFFTVIYLAGFNYHDYGFTIRKWLALFGIESCVGLILCTLVLLIAKLNLIFGITIIIFGVLFMKLCFKYLRNAENYLEYASIKSIKKREEYEKTRKI